MKNLLTTTTPDTTSRKIGRTALGLSLVFAGVGHLTFAREEFQAQVPDWVPVGTDFTVLASGVVEIALGGSLIFLSKRRVVVGLIVAAFFIAVFPGNVGQWLEHKNGFGLDSDSKRLTRLFFQPVLVAWALWSTGAFQVLRKQRD